MNDQKKEQYQQELDKLNEECKKCHKQGVPSTDRCDYHCHTGFQIHKIYCMMGEAPHKDWGKNL